MRSTPISSLRGQILRCYDCGLLCRTSALRPGDDACPRCRARALAVANDGRPYGGAKNTAGIEAR